MIEVKTADAGAGVHGVAFGEFAAGGGGGVKEGEEGLFLGVVRLGRVTRCGTDAAILFADEFVVAEVAGLFDAALEAGLLVQPLGEGLGEAIREGFDDDAGIRVVHRIVGFGILITTVDGDGESADVVGAAAILRRDEIGESVVGRVFLDLLLPKRVQGCAVGQHDVVTDAVGLKVADDAFGGETIILDDEIEQGIRIAVELRGLGFGAGFFVGFVPSAGEGLLLRVPAATQFPSVEEGRPVDEAAQIFDRRQDRFDAEFGRFGDLDRVPVAGEFIRACSVDAEDISGLFLAVFGPHFVVLGLVFEDEGGFVLLADQGSRHWHGA